VGDLRSPDPETRLSAALSLNQSAKPQIIEALRRALADESSEVVEAAAQSLALVGDSDAFELVIEAAERSSAPWPRASVWAAVQLVATTDSQDARMRVVRLLDFADRTGAEGRQQASLLRPLLLPTPDSSDA